MLKLLSKSKIILNLLLFNQFLLFGIALASQQFQRDSLRMRPYRNGDKVILLPLIILYKLYFTFLMLSFANHEKSLQVNRLTLSFYSVDFKLSSPFLCLSPLIFQYFYPVFDAEKPLSSAHHQQICLDYVKVNMF